MITSSFNCLWEVLWISFLRQIIYWSFLSQAKIAAITREPCLQLFKRKPFLERAKTNYRGSWNTYFLRTQCFTMKMFTFWEFFVLTFSMGTQHVIQVFQTLSGSMKPLNYHQILLLKTQNITLLKVDLKNLHETG